MFPMMTNQNWMQDMQSHWAKSMQQFMPALPNMCAAPAPAPVNDPFAMMQQGMQAWQQMFMPQLTAQPAAQFPAPKITVMTIELGDMKPYMDAAANMMAMWNPAFKKMGQGQW